MFAGALAGEQQQLAALGAAKEGGGVGHPDKQFFFFENFFVFEIFSKVEYEYTHKNNEVRMTPSFQLTA